MTRAKPTGPRLRTLPHCAEVSTSALLLDDSHQLGHGLAIARPQPVQQLPASLPHSLK